MLDEERALQLIYTAVDEINGQLPFKARLAKAPGTVLLGDGAVLDSLAFVNLLVAIEDKVVQSGGPSVGLLEQVGEVDNAAPLHTLGSVAAFVAESAKANA